MGLLPPDYVGLGLLWAVGLALLPKFFFFLDFSSNFFFWVFFGGGLESKTNIYIYIFFFFFNSRVFLIL